jgi:SpoVK/Ycf46/Vps4 family AAA+-type ATPase
LFEKARQLSPCIILLDNIDTILGRTNKLNDRQSRTSSVALDRILSTLLVEIDGVMGDSFGGLNNNSSNSNNSGSSSGGRDGAGEASIVPSLNLNRYSKPRPVVVIATTTDISYLDEALLRSGRLEEHLCLDFPDAIQRRKIIDFYISKYFSKFLDDYSKKSPESSTSNSCAITTPIVEEIVTLSAGKSGAFIRQIIQEMSMNTIRLYVSEMKSVAAKDANDGSYDSKSRIEGIIDLVIIRKCVELSFLQVKEKTKLSNDKLSSSKLLFKFPK